MKCSVGYIVGKSDCCRDWGRPLHPWRLYDLMHESWSSRGQKAQLMSELSSQAAIVRIFLLMASSTVVVNETHEAG